MSRQTQIDYQQIATQCKGICELAEERLAEMDKMLATLEQTSLSLLSEQTEALAKHIRAERDALLKSLKMTREVAERYEKDGHGYDTSVHTRTVAAAEALKRQVDVLASSKLVEFQGLLETLLKSSLEDNYRHMLDSSGGVVTLTADVQSVLDSIEDDALRQFTYIAYLQDPSLTGDELIAAGRRLSEETYESRYEREVEKIRAELEAAKVEEEDIEKITAKKGDSTRESLAIIREAASQEIVNEKVRRQALKVITQAIRSRGFIVDKKNIKIKRDTNEVILVALKASGEKAEFRIFLDGKFIYHFHGYEGQACQKDIEPFMHDLEEVYGVHVTKQTEIWSNPDKNATMKYQSVNTNKNRR